MERLSPEYRERHTKRRTPAPWSPSIPEQLINSDVLPTFEAEVAAIDAVLSDNGREFCSREDQPPYELFLQLEVVEHRKTRV